MDNLIYYREVQGVMTRFEPLTDAALQATAEDGLTVSEIKSALERYGLDAKHVVHDPSRALFCTYYADFDHGLYGEIFLQRNLLEGTLPLYAVASRLNGGTVPQLVSRQWVSYYTKCVPLPMLIYDFQRRYLDIPTEEVFQVWHSIYKRIDYSNGMWRPEVLDYVFSHAPVPEYPVPGPDGLITLYRGMGTLSAPPDQAISWSTHPGNALWFAVHTGCGTHVAVARIWPEQIVWYADKFYNENEVIVRPGTITEYRYEDMIPATKRHVPAILAPALPEFIQYGRQVQKLGYQEENIFHFHGLKHILRVLLLSLIYFYNADDPLSTADKRVLIYFSLLHDIGRVNDDKDDTHGEKSVSLIHSKGLRIKDLPMDKKEYRIAELLIRYHCHDDSIGEKAILSAPGLSQKEKAHVIHLYHICKDMDGLDRIRFNGLDYRRLRTDYGRRLPLVAGALLDEPVVHALDMDWSDIISTVSDNGK